jgi:hypothetical protein
MTDAPAIHEFIFACLLTIYFSDLAISLGLICSPERLVVE